ncbi:HIRAN domain-containing protein [Olsenella sp. Marseille-P4559]|uniref:HIRAN domain-containing protein n=1 Tax=Olsenella sp. Marseille-P4559 TaxID=2364795 RepID=UPI0013EF0EAD|nr:HIRAN domain-containing protein [Olsenella sp. Marseille-P4559]
MSDERAVVGPSGTAGGLVAVTSATAGAIIAAIHGQSGLGVNVPKPFSQPICLVPDTCVAGTTHVANIEDLAHGLHEGDHLRLERDDKNAYDHWAIRVLNAHGEHLGYVSADINQIPARLMDGGKRLYGEVTKVELVGSWWKIGMGVWLDD